MDDPIREEIVAFVVENFLFGDEEKMPDEADSLAELGVIDSTGILELIEFLEGRYSIQVADAETVPENLGSVRNLTRYVRAKRDHGT